MARQIGKLSGRQVTTATGPAVLHDGGGLYLRVSNTGAKSWIFRYQLEGKRRDMGLGPYPDIGLADARAKVAELRRKRRDGMDPIEARRAERAQVQLEAAKGKTFREVAEEFIARNETAWRSAVHRRQWRATLAAYTFPIFGDLPVAEIDTGMVIQALDPIWSTKPETASRVRGRIEAVLDAATVRGYREGPNPAMWKGNLAHILPPRGRVRKVEHHAALPYGEIAGFLVDLRRREGTAALALAFAILTATRSSETLGARWSEIDATAKVWTIPANRMKAGREHRVPLSGSALAVLEKVRPLGLFADLTSDPVMPVFPGPRPAVPLSSMALLALLRRMGRDNITAHGFRSTFSDWAAERTAFPREVVEMSLAHRVGSAVEQAYRRSDLFDRRRQLMDAWARFCEAPAGGGEVLPLRQARD